MVRVVVGDDHRGFRAAVVRALASSGAVDVVAEASDGDEALALIKEHLPDVALVDYRMPGLDGAQIAAAVRREELPTRVLLLSAYDESAIVDHALREGVRPGFLVRSPPESAIVTAVLNCARGRDVLSPGLAGEPAGEIGRRTEPADPG